MKNHLLPFSTTTSSRPAVVMLHSSGSSSRQWQALGDTLKPQFEVYAIDLHDHGRQRAWQADTPLTLAGDAALAAEVFQAHDEVHLVGHSYGAAVAAHLALAHPQQVRSLVAYEPVLMSWLIDEQVGHPATRELLAVAALIRASLLSSAPHEAARHFVDYWSGPGTWQAMPEAQQIGVAMRMPAIARHFDALVSQRLPIAQLGGVPSLWLCGGATVGAAHRIAQMLRLALPRAQHETLPGLGHMGPLTHAAVVNGRAQQFVLAHAGLPAGLPMAA